MKAVVFTMIAGFGTGLSLIVAIGAQNAFVLRQGIRREGVAPVVLICIASDVVLIALGVGGLGAMVRAAPSAVTAIGLIGGIFLICYGILAARRAFRPGTLTVARAPVGTQRPTALTCLALTWLNPHVYLDTVLLLGSIAATHGTLRWTFGVGAALASCCWFVALGFGARLLTGFFSRPASWRVLDGLVAVTMFAVGMSVAVDMV